MLLPSFPLNWRVSSANDSFHLLEESLTLKDWTHARTHSMNSMVRIHDRSKNEEPCLFFFLDHHLWEKVLPELNVVDMKSFLDDAKHLNGIQKYIKYLLSIFYTLYLLICMFCLLMVKSCLHAISIPLHIHVPGSPWTFLNTNQYNKHILKEYTWCEQWA